MAKLIGQQSFVAGEGFGQKPLKNSVIRIQRRRRAATRLPARSRGADR
jgi:hypothetical protein